MGLSKYDAGIIMDQKDMQEKKDMKKDDSQNNESPAQLIEARIKELDDWRGETLEKVRRIMKEADPEIVEEWKWRKPVTQEYQSGPTVAQE